MKPTLTSSLLLLSTLILVVLGSGGTNVRAQLLELQWDTTLPSRPIYTAANGSRFALLQSDSTTTKRIILLRGTNLEVIDTVMIDQNTIPPELGGPTIFAFVDSVLCTLVLKDDDSLYVVTYDEGSKQLDTLDKPVSLSLFSSGLDVKLGLVAGHTNGFLLIAISEKGILNSYGDYHENGSTIAYHLSTGTQIGLSGYAQLRSISYSSNRSRFVLHSSSFFRSGDYKVWDYRENHSIHDGESQYLITSLSDSVDDSRLYNATVFDSSTFLVSSCLRYGGAHTWDTIPELECGSWRSLYGRSHLVGLRKPTDNRTELVVADLATRTTQVVDSWEGEGVSYIAQVNSDHQVLAVINYDSRYIRRYTYGPSLTRAPRDTIHVDMPDTVERHAILTMKLTAYSSDPLRIDSVHCDGWDTKGFVPISGKLPYVPAYYSFTAAKGGTHDVIVYATSEKDTSKHLITRRSVYIAVQPGSVFSIKMPRTPQNLHVIDGVLAVTLSSPKSRVVYSVTDSVSALVDRGTFTDDAGDLMKTHAIMGVDGDTMWLARNNGGLDGWGLEIKKYLTTGDSVGMVGCVKGVKRYIDNDIYNPAHPLDYRFQLARVAQSDKVLLSIEPIWYNRVYFPPVTGVLYELEPGVDTLFESKQSLLIRSIDARSGRGVVLSGSIARGSQLAYSYDTVSGDLKTLFSNPRYTTIMDAIYVTDSLVMTTSGLHSMATDGEWVEHIRFDFSDGSDIVPLTDRYSAIIRNQSDTVAVVVNHYTGDVVANIGSIYGNAHIGVYSPDSRILIIASDMGVLAGYDVSHVVSVPATSESTLPAVSARYHDGRIEISAQDQVSGAELYDLSGCRVATSTFSGDHSEATFLVGGVPSGVYVLRVIGGERLASVIVQITR